MLVFLYHHFFSSLSLIMVSYQVFHLLLGFSFQFRFWFSLFSHLFLHRLFFIPRLDHYHILVFLLLLHSDWWDRTNKAFLLQSYPLKIIFSILSNLIYFFSHFFLLIFIYHILVTILQPSNHSLNLQEVHHR